MPEKMTPENAAEVERLLSGIAPDIDYAENERQIEEATRAAEAALVVHPAVVAEADRLIGLIADDKMKPLPQRDTKWDEWQSWHYKGRGA